MRVITYIQAIREALQEEMERDDRVFVLGEDVRVGVMGATRGLYERFGGGGSSTPRLVRPVSVV